MPQHIHNIFIKLHTVLWFIPPLFVCSYIIMVFGTFIIQCILYFAHSVGRKYLLSFPYAANTIVTDFLSQRTGAHHHSTHHVKCSLHVYALASSSNEGKLLRLMVGI